MSKHDQPIKEFTWIEGLALFLSCIAIQLCSEVMTQWGFFFYSPGEGTGRTVYVVVGLAGLIFTIGLFFDAITDPIIGLWSDNTRTRPGRWRLIPISGRRRPFIFCGSIGMVFTGILFWYPPFDGTSTLNFVYATFIYCLHSGIFFTMCMIPFNSLAPEITRSQQARVKIGSWIAAGMIIGLACAEIAPGILVEVLDPEGRAAREAAPQQAMQAVAIDTAFGSDYAPAQSVLENGDCTKRCEAETGLSPFSGTALNIFSVLRVYNARSFSPVGYQRTAILFAFLSLALFQFTIWTVRERYHSEKAPPRAPSYTVVRQAFANKVFLRFIAIFFLFNIGFLGVQRVLPHWVQIGLHGTESLVSVLMVPFILSALLALVLTDILARRIPIKWLLFIALTIIAAGLPFMYVIAIAQISTTAKLVYGGILFTFCGLGQGMIYVLFTPLVGEIIDYDEITSGERREAVYTSLTGLAWKGSQALSVGVAAFCMHTWGNSVEQPLGIFIIGPLAGLFGLLGMAVCYTYPVLHVTKEPGNET